MAVSSWSPTPEKGSKLCDNRLYGVSPTRAYLCHASSPVDPLLRAYLEACLAGSPAFYEIDIRRPLVGFRVQDVLSKTELDVSEGLAFRNVGPIVRRGRNGRV